MKKSQANSAVHEPRVENPREPLCQGEGPFRHNAAALIVRQGFERSTQILLGNRFDMPANWQWPQGGLDEGETPLACLRRELQEEIGVGDVEVRYQFPFRLRYRFPQTLGKKFLPNIGQEQWYFIATLREGDPPDLERATAGEFRELRWFALEDALNTAVWFKLPVYREALAHARPICADLWT